MNKQLGRSFLLLFLSRKKLKYIKYLYFKIRSPFYSGRRYYCPICRGGFRTLLPTGYSGNRRRALCPGCGSSERSRLLYLYFTNKTNLFDSNLTLLHFAPEMEFYTLFKKLQNINYIPTDLSSALGDFRMDITKIILKDNSIDVIICSHVLEHVKDDIKAMSELFRVLKSGGYAIIQVPIDYQREETYETPLVQTPEERLEIYGHPDHVRQYGMDYSKRLHNVGFDVIVDDYVKRFDNKQIQKYCLDETEYIYFCRKSINTAKFIQSGEK